LLRLRTLFKSPDFSSYNPAINELKLSIEQYEAWGSDRLSNQVGYKVFKRLIDIFISIAGLALIILIYPIVAIINQFTSPGPVIFMQERVGLKGKVFTLYKFRTMVNDAEKHTGPVWAKADDDRITPVGKILRKTRIDELPQIVNVLKGEMSFIGPRPERLHFVNQLKDQIPMYLRRLQVKPGLTGWAQINVNYDRTIEDVKTKLSYDLYYIDNMSFSLDLSILLKTVKVVLIGKGAH
jgi:exopolysaccharide biosynthesis polyprenyl glycosylphosphotransferase